MRVAVVGAGAIGSWLGAALARAGHDVALVARGRHLDAMRRTGGVVLHSAAGAETVPLLATGDAREVGAVDAVLLAVKAHDQAAAGVAVGPLLGPGTPVVAAQNGIPWWYFHGHARHPGRRVETVDRGGAVSALLSPARAIGLVVYLGARVVAPGVVEGRPEAGLVIGEPDGSDSPRMTAVADALEGAGFPVRRTPAIRAELWTKLMGNAAFNPVSILTRAGLGTMARDPGTRAVVARVMAETVAVAAALGDAPDISIEDRLALTERLGDHKTSTLQDLEAGRRLELDALTGAVVELADLTGVAVPQLRTLHALASLLARSAPAQAPDQAA
jgi:2-dehydropantoate 2-reductase